jgi:hypothetical protein
MIVSSPLQKFAVTVGMIGGIWEKILLRQNESSSSNTQHKHAEGQFKEPAEFSTSGFLKHHGASTVAFTLVLAFLQRTYSIGTAGRQSLKTLKVLGLFRVMLAVHKVSANHVRRQLYLLQPR